MKEKILKLMKTSWSKFGFKAAELEGFADLVSKNLADDATDEEINNAISGAEVYASMAQKVMNRGVQDTENKYKGWVKPESKAETETKTEQQPMSQEQMMAAMMVKMQEMLNPLLNERKQEKLHERLVNDDRLKNIPKSFLRHYSLEDESKLDDVVTGITDDYAAVLSEQVKGGLVATIPQGGGGQAEGVVSDEDIKSLAATL